MSSKYPNLRDDNERKENERRRNKHATHRHAACRMPPRRRFVSFRRVVRTRLYVKGDHSTSYRDSYFSTEAILTSSLTVPNQWNFDISHEFPWMRIAIIANWKIVGVQIPRPAVMINNADKKKLIQHWSLANDGESETILQPHLILWTTSLYMPIYRLDWLFVCVKHGKWWNPILLEGQVAAAAAAVWNDGHGGHHNRILQVSSTPPSWCSTAAAAATTKTTTASWWSAEGWSGSTSTSTRWRSCTRREEEEEESTFEIQEPCDYYLSYHMQTCYISVGSMYRIVLYCNISCIDDIYACIP